MLSSIPQTASLARWGNAKPGEHILKAAIAPVEGKEDAADNMVTVTPEVKES